MNTENFRYDEFIRSDYAVRYDIDNTPNARIQGTIQSILMPNMQLVRYLLDNVVTITSGYRCKSLNTRVGGATHSTHMQGTTCDFVCPAFGTPKEIVEHLVKSYVHFAKVIDEFGKWVHIEFPLNMPQREVLAARKIGGHTRYITLDLENLT